MLLVYIAGSMCWYYDSAIAMADRSAAQMSGGAESVTASLHWQYTGHVSWRLLQTRMLVPVHSVSTRKSWPQLSQKAKTPTDCFASPNRCWTEIYTCDIWPPCIGTTPTMSRAFALHATSFVRHAIKHSDGIDGTNTPCCLRHLAATMGRSDGCTWWTNIEQWQDLCNSSASLLFCMVQHSLLATGCTLQTHCLSCSKHTSGCCSDVSHIRNTTGMWWNLQYRYALCPISQSPYTLECYIMANRGRSPLPRHGYRSSRMAASRSRTRSRVPLRRRDPQPVRSPLPRLCGEPGRRPLPRHRPQRAARRRTPSQSPTPDDARELHTGEDGGFFRWPRDIQPADELSEASVDVVMVSPSQSPSPRHTRPARFISPSPRHRPCAYNNARSPTTSSSSNSSSPTIIRVVRSVPRDRSLEPAAPVVLREARQPSRGREQVALEPATRSPGGIRPHRIHRVRPLERTERRKPVGSAGEASGRQSITVVEQEAEERRLASISTMLTHRKKQKDEKKPNQASESEAQPIPKKTVKKTRVKSKAKAKERTRVKEFPTGTMLITSKKPKGYKECRVVSSTEAYAMSLQELQQQAKERRLQQLQRLQAISATVAEAPPEERSSQDGDTEEVIQQDANLENAETLDVATISVEPEASLPDAGQEDKKDDTTAIDRQGTSLEGEAAVDVDTAATDRPASSDNKPVDDTTAVSDVADESVQMDLSAQQEKYTVPMVHPALDAIHAWVFDMDCVTQCYCSTAVHFVAGIRKRSQSHYHRSLVTLVREQLQFHYILPQVTPPTLSDPSRYTASVHHGLDLSSCTINPKQLQLVCRMIAVADLCYLHTMDEQVDAGFRLGIYQAQNPYIDSLVAGVTACIATACPAQCLPKDGRITRRPRRRSEGNPVSAKTTSLMTPMQGWNGKSSTALRRHLQKMATPPLDRVVQDGRPVPRREAGPQPTFPSLQCRPQDQRLRCAQSLNTVHASKGTRAPSTSCSGHHDPALLITWWAASNRSAATGDPWYGGPPIADAGRRLQTWHLEFSEGPTILAPVTSIPMLTPRAED